MAVITPKLRVPFSMIGDHASVVEQDSDEEVIACAYAILATEIGEREVAPAFGIADPTFRQGGADLDELRTAVETWEPRAEFLAESKFVDLVQRVRVSVT